MTSKTSLFNYGLYINNLKRFKWGSILYFIILFFSVPFGFLVTDFTRLTTRFINQSTAYLFRTDLIVLPVLMAIVVPTVVAALVFNSVHSAKQSVFVHGLPTDRRENYISQLCASFTLMGLPVIFNGLILLFMSFGKYGMIISSSSVLYWVLTNLAILFIMYSISSATAFLTGNTITHIILNIFIHTIPLIIALIIALICENFLYGYISSSNSVTSLIMEYTPIVWIFSNATYPSDSFQYIFKDIAFWCYMGMAIIFYFTGFLLYKKRKMELSGDVVAYKIFRPIFKYALCVAGASVILGILNQTNLPAFAQFIVAIAGIAIIYFGAEMFMNKSFKVFRFYKGFIAFLIICGLFISFFAFTNVFGYETYIPDVNDIEKASVHTQWGEDIPLIADKKVILDTVSIHQEFLEDIPVTKSDILHSYLKITYLLKNGKTVERHYLTDKDTFDNAMRKMYENAEYKYKITGIDKLNIENIKSLNLSSYMPLMSHNINITENADKFMELVKKDIALLSYDELELFHNPVHYSVNIDITSELNEQMKIFKEEYFANTDYYDHYVHSFGITLNSKFKNAFEFLKDNGYYKEMVDVIATSAYITKDTYSVYDQTNEIDDDITGIYNIKADVSVIHETRVTPDETVFIEYNDATALTENILLGSDRTDDENGEFYFVFIKSTKNTDNVYLSSSSYRFKKDELPDYLKNYVN